MSEQKGIANALQFLKTTRDWNSWLRKGAINPVRRYTGIHHFGNIGTGTMTPDRIYLTPILNVEDATLFNICYKVTTAAAGENIRFGLYSNQRANLYPETLLEDWGEYSVGSVGTFYTSALNKFLPGEMVFWLARWISGGSPWMASFSALQESPMVGFANDATGYAAVGYYFNKIYDGVFPDPFPDFAAGARPLQPDDRHPALFLRFDNP